MAGKKNESGSGRKRKTSLSVRFAIFMSLVAAVVFLPLTIIFFVCMIPTLVAAIVDNNARKTAWLTVGAMNLAGTVPVWCTLIDRGHTIPEAFQLVLDPSMLLLAYGGAFAGWVLYNKVTPLVAKGVQIRNEHRLKEIAKRQEDLVKKWGEKVVP